MNTNIFKSIGAVLVGFITVVILSVVTDMILEKTGVFPPVSEAGLFVTWMLVLALFYRTIYTILGGYITSKLSPQNPQKHVNILGIIGTIAGILGVVAGWNLSEHWYPISLAVLAFPSVWIGGKIQMGCNYINSKSKQQTNSKANTTSKEKTKGKKR